MTVAARPTYSDPAYGTRLSFTGVCAAGAAAQSGKFVAHANLLLFSLNVALLIAGTSTYTSTNTGVGTSVISVQQLSLIQILNTAAAGSTQALSTTTIGPFLAGVNFYSGGTGTGQTFTTNQYALNTNTGTSGIGGLYVPAGATLYVVSGTDATASSAFTIDYQIAPLAGVVI